MDDFDNLSEILEGISDLDESVMGDEEFYNLVGFNRFLIWFGVNSTEFTKKHPMTILLD